MSEKKSGHVCAVSSCKIKGYNSKKKFYRFPKNPNRAQIWAMKANREDLLEKLPDLHKSYRLCENHFEENMFTNQFHTRLVDSALPTLFLSLEGSCRTTKDDHSYCAPPLFSAKIRVLFDRILVPASVSSIAVNEETFPETKSDENSLKTEKPISQSTNIKEHIGPCEIAEPSTHLRIKEEPVEDIEIKEENLETEIGEPLLQTMKEEPIDSFEDIEIKEDAKVGEKISLEFAEQCLNYTIKYLKQCTETNLDHRISLLEDTLQELPMYK